MFYVFSVLWKRFVLVYKKGTGSGRFLLKRATKWICGYRSERTHKGGRASFLRTPHITSTRLDRVMLRVRQETHEDALC